MFISVILNIGALINILVAGNCRDAEQHDNFNECEDIKVVLLILIVIIFSAQIAGMVYLAINSNRFLKEYEEEHKEELDAQHRLLH